MHNEHQQKNTGLWFLIYALWFVCALHCVVSFVVYGLCAVLCDLVFCDLCCALRSVICTLCIVICGLSFVGCFHCEFVLSVCFVVLLLPVVL